MKRKSFPLLGVFLFSFIAGLFGGTSLRLTKKMFYQRRVADIKREEETRMEKLLERLRNDQI